MLSADGASRQGGADGMAAHGDDQVGAGQKLEGDRLGDMAARLMPRSANAVTTVGFRASAGSVPAESARTPGGWWALSRAAATMLRPALWVQTNSTRRSDACALTGGSRGWLPGWAGRLGSGGSRSGQPSGPRPRGSRTAA